MAFSNSASPEIIWGLGGPEEDHQLHHCCWTGLVSEREEEDRYNIQTNPVVKGLKLVNQSKQSIYQTSLTYDKHLYEVPDSTAWHGLSPQAK